MGAGLVREGFFASIEGSRRFLCAVVASALVLPARSAPYRILEGDLPATTDPTFVLRSPLTHKPWAAGGRLSLEERDAVNTAIGGLEEDGPSRGRPIVDTIGNSAYKNMKELRPPSSSIRILFVFDRRRAAIRLLSGDKQGQWDTWYDKNVPIADALYAGHLETLEKELLL